MPNLFINLPKEFDYSMNLEFLERSPRELLHRIDGEKVLKLVRFNDEKILFAVKQAGNRLKIEFLNGEPSAAAKQFVRSYVTEWFDLETDLKVFYDSVSSDK